MSDKVICYTSDHHIAIPPGDFIKEQLENRNMTQREFARRMGMSEKHISQLMTGKVELTMDVALRIESIFNMEAGFWIRLEQAYRENLAKVEEENKMASEIELSRELPYFELTKLGWLPKSTFGVERVKNWRHYFEVYNLEVLKDLDSSEMLFSHDETKEEGINYGLAAWGQYAKIKSREQEVKTFNMTQLTNKLTKIKALIGEDPTIYLPKLTELLAKAGVALVLLPPIEDSQTRGFTFKEKGRVVIALPAIGRSDAYFWKAFLREIYCITVGAIYTDINPIMDEEDINLFLQEYEVPEGQYVLNAS